MSHELHTLFNVALAIGIALLGGLIAHRLRQSPIVGYLLAGMAMGPFATGLVTEREQIQVLAEVGVIFLMFALGLEFSLKELERQKGPAIIGTIAQVLLVLGGGTAYGYLLGWPGGQSLFFGGVICVSSTMVILKTLMSRGEVGSNHGRLLLGMLIVQDLAVVILILVLPKLATGHVATALPGLVITTIKAAAFITATLILGERVVPRFMRHVGNLQSRELFLLTAVFLALGSAGISTWLGLSPALGAFLAGLLLTETEFEHRVLAEMEPMRDLFGTLFFVSMGMLIDVFYVGAHWPLILLTALFIITLKAVVTLGVLAPFNLGGKTTVFAGLGMISIGEFSYVIAQAGLSQKIIPEDTYNLIAAASLLTIMLTPGAFWVAPRFERMLCRLPLLRQCFEPEKQLHVESEVLLQPHAIVMGYGRVGRRVARGLRQAKIPVVVIERDLHLVRELRKDKMGAIYGDASYPSVLEAAHPEAASIIVVTLPDFGATRQVVQNARRANADVTIVARATRAEQDVHLREAGATTVVVPELAGAFMLLEETLMLMGVKRDDVFVGISSLPVASTLTSDGPELEAFGSDEALNREVV